jgi:hypothetical protein
VWDKDEWGAVLLEKVPLGGMTWHKFLSGTKINLRDLA